MLNVILRIINVSLFMSFEIIVKIVFTKVINPKKRPLLHW